MTRLASAAAGGYGVHLLFTALVGRWTGLGLGDRASRAQRPNGHNAVRAAKRAAVEHRVKAIEAFSAAALGAATGWALFASALPTIAAATLAASLPVTARRSRQRRQRAEAMEAWPHILEEVRVRTGSLGRSIPQALFEAGRRAPEPLVPLFAAAHRTWLISTDFEHTVAELKDRFADPTADAACETLLVAYQLGGADLDRRLRALIDDRVRDLADRKDARARQAGARFARRFVLLVPLGMACAGLSIGDGRAAYGTPSGQLAVAVGLGLVAACWWWSGRLLRLPMGERTFRP